MFSNVVWATDGSEHADRALQYARDLVQREGGTLHVTHIVEKLIGVRVAGENAHADEPEIEAKVKRQAEEAAADAINVQVHTRVGRAGEIARLIAAVANEAGADVIVIGTRGHSAMVGAVIGSVAQRLLHVADCPVLSVPPARRETEKPEPSDAVATAG